MASFNEIIAAAMRLIGVCLLNGDSRPAEEERGGIARVGSSNLLRVLVHGTREAGAVHGGTADPGNGTVASKGSGAGHL